MARALLEICVDSAEGLAAAIEGGANRIELCSALDGGGLTPSPGLIALAAAAPVPVYAMIRPRAGDFVFGLADRAAMRADIAAVRRAGLAGVVLGASLPDGALDAALLAELLSQTAGMGRTLHRAFDLAPDLFAALDAAASLGFERVLTSGGAPSALEGADTLAALVAHAGSRLSVMPGAGIRPANAAEILSRTKAREFHASARAQIPADPVLSRFGFAPPQLLATDRGMVAALRATLDA